MWTTKRDIRLKLEHLGGKSVTSSTCRFDVLVLGELENSPVLEPENSLGEKAIYVFDRRIAGQHLMSLTATGSADCCAANQRHAFPSNGTTPRQVD